MRRWILSLNLLVPIVIVAAVATAQDSGPTTVLLARHAEKQTGGDGNPDLTAKGAERAEELGRIAGERGVNAIYSTEFCRTALTAQAAAVELRMPIAVQEYDHPAADLENCTPAISVPVILLDQAVADEAALAEHILMTQLGRTILVVGHSNTVPAVISALGGGQLDEPTISDDQYDRLFTVTIAADGTAELAEEKFGTER